MGLTLLCPAGVQTLEISARLSTPSPDKTTHYRLRTVFVGSLVITVRAFTQSFWYHVWHFTFGFSTIYNKGCEAASSHAASILDLGQHPAAGGRTRRLTKPAMALAQKPMFKTTHDIVGSFPIGTT
jgi:hypothetical protein